LAGGPGEQVDAAVGANGDHGPVGGDVGGGQPRAEAPVADFERARPGQPDPTRSDHRAWRLWHMLKEVLGNTKMLNFTGTGMAHWVVMVGFVTLFGTLVTAYGQVTNPHFALPFIGHFIPYEYYIELITILTGIGIVTLIGIRQFTRIFRKGRTSRFFGSGSLKAYYIEATILAIVVCEVALRSLDGALSNYYRFTWH